MIIENVNDILSIRDQIGAIKHHVFIASRVWDEEKGKGSYIDSTKQILPTPYLLDYSHNISLKEAGSYKQGDLLVKHISKQTYSESDIDCTVTDDKTEKFYLINGKIYEVISITEDYLYFNVQLRGITRKW